MILQDRDEVVPFVDKSNKSNTINEWKVNF